MILRILFLAIILVGIDSNSFVSSEDDDLIYIDKSSQVEKNSVRSEMEEKSFQHIQSASTISPTWEPTEFPVLEPTDIPTELPTSHSPTVSPILSPTSIPSIPGTQSPTTLSPSITPSLTSRPTFHPTYVPTTTPTLGSTSYAPTMAPSFQNRPIIRVECNITLFNISVTSLNEDEKTAINRATALMLKVPFDRVSTARWQFVGVQATRRRKLSISEYADADISEMTAPVSLWDVDAEEVDFFSRDEQTTTADDDTDSESINISTSKTNNQNIASAGTSPLSQQPRNIQTDIGVFYDSSQDAFSPKYNSFNSSSLINNNHDDPEEEILRPLLRENPEKISFTPTSPLNSIFSWLSRTYLLPAYVSLFQKKSSNVPPVTSDLTLASSGDIYYEFFYTAQVEVMMVDFPEYRSITNGTRLMNFLRQRVRSNLRTGNFSRNIQVQWQNLGYTSSSSAMIRASATRVVLRNQGLVFAPSFAPTPSPIAVKENAAVATSIAGLVVGIAAGCLVIGAILVICAARRAEHQLPPKPVELTSLLSIEEGKEEHTEVKRDHRFGKGKMKAARAGKPNSSKIAGMEEDDENAILSSALKYKPQQR